MKALVFLAALALVGLVVTGAIHLQKSSDNSFTIEVDKNIAKQDADEVIQKGEQFFHEAESNLQSRAQDGVSK
jgi:Tfp pilus assembly protein PilX